MKRDNVYVCFSGPICAGKDTIIDLLRARGNLEPLLEPEHQVFYLSEAINHDTAVLDAYYQDQNRTGIPFELATLCTRLVLASSIPKKQGIVIGNRHIIEARHTFVEYAQRTRDTKADPFFREAEGYYDSLLHIALKNGTLPIPDITFYLDVSDPEIILKRNRTRNAAGEGSINTEYLKGITEEFRRYIANFEQIHQNWSVKSPRLKVFDASVKKEGLAKIAEECEKIIGEAYRQR
ncbi:deoxynucleoside kinase [Candidatus Woesearchaeota archaeon]|nr:deoxynucleoside kinase [Candidatus Woesearchaeota archaeon]